ncbi:MAG: metallophosphoesterase family protein [Alphaproteobacteria bacterium]
MKILAFSDLHRNKIAAQMIVDASASADVVVGAGDFATKGVGAVETLNILKNISVPVVLVHGNHETAEEISFYCAQWPNLHYLHGSSVEINDQVFFGLGGEIPAQPNNLISTSETEERAAELLANCPKGAVLVTHSPPFGVGDLQKNGKHEGSTSILEAATKLNPKLLLCGHIHYAWGTSGKIGGCAVHNLGPTINWFEI